MSKVDICVDCGKFIRATENSYIGKPGDQPRCVDCAAKQNAPALKAYRFRVLDEQGNEQMYGVYANSFEEACRKKWHHLGTLEKWLKTKTEEVSLIDSRIAEPGEEEEEKHLQFMFARIEV